MERFWNSQILGVYAASVRRPDAHTNAPDGCVYALASFGRNDGATGRLLRIEGAQVDVIAARSLGKEEEM